MPADPLSVLASAAEGMVPCISLWQPYASLIAVGAKPFETRSWCAPGRVIGRRIAIHAAARKPTQAEFSELDESASDAFGFCHWHLRIPYGAVVCTATLVGSYRITGEAGGMRMLDGRAPIHEDAFGDYAPGRWIWELADIELLSPALPAKGHRGWWAIPLAALRAREAAP